MKIEKITYQELKKAFIQHNRDNNITTKYDPNPIYGVIVFDPVKSGWKEEFLNCSFEDRAYRVSSCNKAFIPEQCGYSIFSENLLGTDAPRLEQYMKAECGDEDGWVVDYCYLEK